MRWLLSNLLSKNDKNLENFDIFGGWLLDNHHTLEFQFLSHVLKFNLEQDSRMVKLILPI